MNLKKLLIQALEVAVFPAVDLYVKKGLHTPFEIDDKIWAIVKKRLEEKLDNIQFTQEDGLFGMLDAKGRKAADSLTIKELFKQWVTETVLPIVDEIFRDQIKLPFDLDDRFWAVIRKKIEAMLNTIEFVQMSKNKFDVKHVA